MFDISESHSDFGVFLCRSISLPSFLLFASNNYLPSLSPLPPLLPPLSPLPPPLPILSPLPSALPLPTLPLSLSPIQNLLLNSFSPTTNPFLSIHPIHAHQSSSHLNVSRFPTTIIPSFALVSDTFNLRESFRNPRSPRELLRTVEMTISGFSLPWKPSTVETSTSG